MTAPAGLVLLALGVMILLAPLASRPMTVAQQRRWQAGLGIGSAVLLLLVVAAGVYGLRNDPF